MIKIAPSILSADFSRLGEEIELLDKSGADIIHIDVMDGHFVPNLTFGMPVVKAIRKYTKLPFDVHLMIENPAMYVKDFIDAGADIITVHYESDRHIDRTINLIKENGCKAGIVINPGTSVEVIKHLIPIVDMILIMSVNPGFGGQKFIEYSVDKIKEVRAIADKVNKDLMIEVDGGITTDNIGKVVAAGADVLVAGSAVFNGGKVKENIAALKAQAK
ncbi:ribulose-phosphate 3-epimerase [Clostridium bornimense]|uniref:ribulose-phosphate 3-epimerase n=1 Tax=Clostridium bornimense TaxID=1216932 RepID=UPI001C0F3BCF|nr:ribulose-phosphate 3-epimerase [Clostridium bornimense]MBU5316304.1 ribulose-phosphate 3-epimerase [Clostridium bornimense]